MDINPDDFQQGDFDKLRPSCVECGKPDDVDMAQPEFIYPTRPDLWQRADGTTPWYWHCRACGAYCGTKAGTFKPLGRPGGPETRKARGAAYAAFDPLWKKRQRISNIATHHARNKGLKWLAEQLGIDLKECQIGNMDAATALRVVQICKGAKA